MTFVEKVSQHFHPSTKGNVMWDTVQTTVHNTGHSKARHLSHDLPCPGCGHAVHTYLPCDDKCDCPPTVMPGTVALAA
jgi:hypothetical protein